MKERRPHDAITWGASLRFHRRTRPEQVRRYAYRCVGAAARNRQNQLRPSSLLRPVATGRVRSSTPNHGFWFTHRQLSVSLNRPNDDRQDFAGDVARATRWSEKYKSGCDLLRAPARLAICDPLPLLYPELFHDRFGIVADLGNRGIDLGSRSFETLAPMPREILAG